MTTTQNDYWLASNALSIVPNALDIPNYIQASCIANAYILVYVKGVIDYDAGHNYQRWPLQASPTVFTTNTEKYVYVAIPRDSNTRVANVVFPSEEIDIYGRNKTGDQIGSTQYYYIYLHSVLSNSGDNGTIARRWKNNQEPQTGYLSSDEALAAGPTDSAWYQYSAVSQLTTFLKDLTMKVGTMFRQLFAHHIQIMPDENGASGSIAFGKETSEGVYAGGQVSAVATFQSLEDTQNDHIVTPDYLQKRENAVEQKYLRKDLDDQTDYSLTAKNLTATQVESTFATVTDYIKARTGQIIEMMGTVPNIDVQLLVDQITSRVSEYLSLNDNILVKNDGSIKHRQFSPDIITGDRWQIDSEGKAELEELIVRSFIETPEFRYNRVTVETGVSWSCAASGVIKRTNDQAKFFDLKLEDGEIGTFVEGDICMGNWHFANNNATIEDEERDKTGLTVAGFDKVYFLVEKVENYTDEDGEFVNGRVYYSLKPNTARQPQVAMNVVGYGNYLTTVQDGKVVPKYPSRTQSRYQTKTFMRFLVNMNNATEEFLVVDKALQAILGGTIGQYVYLDQLGNYTLTNTGLHAMHKYRETVWDIAFPQNIALHAGDTSGLTVTERDGTIRDLGEYSLFLSNIYLKGGMVQLDVKDLTDSEGLLGGAYGIEIVNAASNLTIDANGEYSLYDEQGRAKLTTGVVVRRGNEPMLYCDSFDDIAQYPDKERYYKLEIIPQGCSVERLGATININAIDQTTLDNGSCSVVMTATPYGSNIALEKTYYVALTYDGQQGLDGITAYLDNPSVVIDCTSDNKPVASGLINVTPVVLQGTTPIEYTITDCPGMTNHGTYATFSWSKDSRLESGTNTLTILVDGSFMSLAFSVIPSVQGAAGVGQTGAMLRRRGTFSLNETYFYNGAWCDWTIRNGIRYRLGDAVLSWSATEITYCDRTTLDITEVVPDGTRYVPSGQPRNVVDDKGRVVWQYFSELNDVAVNFLIADRIDSTEANICEAFIGTGGTINADGSITVSDEAVGWMIKNGSIRHTKTGFELTADGGIKSGTNGKLDLYADALNCYNKEGVKTAFLDSLGNFITAGVHMSLIQDIDVLNDKNTHLLIPEIVDNVTMLDYQGLDLVHTDLQSLDVMTCANVIRIIRTGAICLPCFISDKTNDVYIRTATRNGGTLHLITQSEIHQIMNKEIYFVCQGGQDDVIITNPRVSDVDPAMTDLRAIANGEIFINEFNQGYAQTITADTGKVIRAKLVSGSYHYDTKDGQKIWNEIFYWQLSSLTQAAQSWT